ncbi:Acyl-CoA N-acyltransferase [Penicillium concentricum]|uniref:Acyl-CoA N-acyltransferase n=1 Tax=Penicillium concentricum TaxID=293559 RepID=A0A9W9SEZ9_9EURO|nr:Acyl-CoA N-acyltransferase [Penicillium concentricum]KAJ5374953.1 Acyl-CoA N-acyltransferase [Penicillium concentricum]
MSFYPSQTTSVIVTADLDPIHTSRLYLRPLTVADAAAIFEIRRRQDVADWLWPKVPHKDISESEAVITKKTFTTPDASGAVGRKFFFAIIRSEDPSQRVIGGAGINALSPAPSVGYNIHPDFWGKGYATEAVAGIIDAWWKLDRMGFEGIVPDLEKEKLYAACNRANVGSMKVLQRTGFGIYHEESIEGDVVALFELENPTG